MSWKYKLAPCLMLLLATTVYAQRPQQTQNMTPEQRQAMLERMPKASVEGIVIDIEEGEPLIGATISVWSERDSTLITGTVTDARGAFALEELLPQPMYVQVSFVGFATRTIGDLGLSRDNLSIDMGTIEMGLNPAMMGEVQVTAERQLMEVQIDRTVYNTKDQPNLAGASTTELLENIPSVEVDMDGNLSLRGSQNVAVLINGRPAQMPSDMLAAYLQGLSANQVERIEVMPNPSARYEPDGMSGIINIVMKRDAELGVSGAITGGLGTDGDYNASGNLGLNKGPWNVRVNYGFRFDKRDSFGDTFREDRFRDPLTFLDQVDRSGRNGNSHRVGTSVDYRLTKKNTLSLSASLSARSGDNAGVNAYSIFDAQRDLTSRYDRISSRTGDSFNMDYSLAFSRIIKSGQHELTADARYGRDMDDDLRTYRQQLLTLTGELMNDTPELQNVDNERANENFSAQVDYIRPFAGGKLEAGAKGTMRTLGSELFAQNYDYDTSAFLPDATNNNTFDFSEQVYSAYGIMAREFGSLGVQGGVRAEQAMTNFDLKTTGEDYDNNYFSVFPSAFLTYKLDAGKSFKASYSKRINRPRSRSLNPFDNLDDPLFRRVGNPRLSPEYVHSFEVGYNQFTNWGSISFTPYFRRTVDVIRRYQFIQPDGVTVMTFENFDTSDSYGTELISSMRLGSRIRGFGSFNFYRIVTDGSNVEADLGSGSTSFSTRFNATIQLQPSLSLQLTYFYRAPVDIEGGRIDAFQMSSVSLQQKLFNDRASVSLRVSDVFDQSGFSLYREDNLYYQELSRRWDARRAMLTFSYNFGKQQRDTVRRRGGDEGGSFDPEDMGM